MNLTLTRAALPTEQVDLLGVFAFEDDLPPSESVAMPAIDPAIAALLQSAIVDQRFKGKLGQTLLVDTQGRIGARRIALIGAGSRRTFKVADYRHPAAALARISSTVGARSLFVAGDSWDGRAPGPVAAGERGTPERAKDADNRTPDAPGKRLQALAEGLFLGTYRFDRYLDEQKRTPSRLEAVVLQTTSADTGDLTEGALARGERVARATCNARDLVNEPAGTLTPSALARYVTERAAGSDVEVKVLGREECRARGMGMFLAVAQGSSEEPKFIHLAWRPPGARRRVVLVGKGVTFDSGGLSLKTTEGMLDMKSDMAGAAAVLSAIMVAAEEKLPVEVHALAACTENMPSGTAYKLGDVLRSMSGKTVEINNTDAEGRLTLADALTYGLELHPDVVLDFATLTGACVVALGLDTAGVMTNDEAALGPWMAASRAAGECMWQLPLPPRLIDQLKSEIADLRNTGERWGGALTAGLFLKEFVGSTPWIHVDLAGPATTTKEWGCFGKGATGFGVATIVEYLRAVAVPNQA